MCKKNVVCLLLLFMINMSLAQNDDVNIGAGVSSPMLLPLNDTPSITIIDTKSQIPIRDAMISVMIETPLQNFSYETFSDSEGEISIRANQNKIEKMQLFVDIPSTPGKDYYGYFELNGRIPKDISLFRVGTIRGMVVDKLGNVIPFAELEFLCNTEFGEDGPKNTNKYGFFTYDYAPSGDCQIIALHQDSLGKEEVQVSSGQITHVQINLDKSLLPYQEKRDNKQSSTIFFFMLFLIFFGLFLFRRGTVSKKTPSRQKDIMKTLNHKEKNVVKFLMGKNEYISQNELSREVGIPKTSLSRVVVTLEEKNIVQTESIGKYKKIKLTKWFLV